MLKSKPNLAIAFILCTFYFPFAAFAEEPAVATTPATQNIDYEEMKKIVTSVEFTDFGALNMDVGIFAPAVFKALRFGILGGFSQFSNKESDGKFIDVYKPDLKIQLKAGGRISEYFQAMSVIGVGQQWMLKINNVKYFEVGFEQGLVAPNGFVSMGVAWRSHFIQNTKQLDDTGALLRKDLLVPKFAMGRYF